MANKAKKNTNLIVGICAALVIIVVVIVAIVLATKGGGAALNDSYFVSDDAKYVLTLDADELATEDEEYTPVKAHMVYFYSGDDITDMKIYYEFADEKTAQSALTYYEESVSDGEYKSVVVDGKYLIITANESDYEGITASDVKQQIEFMEMLKNMDLEDSYEDEDEDETIEIDEEVVEE